MSESSTVGAMATALSGHVLCECQHAHAEPSAWHPLIARIKTMNVICKTLVLAILVLCRAPHSSVGRESSRCGRVNQTQSAVRRLVKGLSHSNNDARAKAAAALRPILAADPSLAPNWHDKTFWCRRIKKCKPRMLLDDALAVLLPELSIEERKKTRIGGAGDGGGGETWYQLD